MNEPTDKNVPSTNREATEDRVDPNLVLDVRSQANSEQPECRCPEVKTSDGIFNITFLDKVKEVLQSITSSEENKDLPDQNLEKQKADTQETNSNTTEEEKKEPESNLSEAEHQNPQVEAPITVDSVARKLEAASEEAGLPQAQAPGLDKILEKLAAGIPLTVEELEALEQTQAGGAESGHYSDLSYLTFGTYSGVDSVPRDLGIAGINFEVTTIPGVPPTLSSALVLNTPIPEAVDDINNVNVVEAVCKCGDSQSVVSSTTATGNLFSNDINLAETQSTISKISTSQNPNGIAPNANGVIVISGLWGTLVVETTGAQAGHYTYNLNNTFPLPPDGSVEIFTYTLTDVQGNTTSADLSIGITVTQIEITTSEAVNDTNAICVVEKVYACNCDESTTKVVSSTVAQGNLLANDLNLGIDPSTITKIVDANHPNGVMPDLNGIITIEGEYGILVVHTTGETAGQYTYTLKPDVTPPKGVEDLFIYTLTDAYGCSSNAVLDIDLYVKKIHVPPPEAVEDANAICVVEKVYDCDCNPTVKVISSTVAQGNLLSNDLHLNIDTSKITKITDAQHPNGVTPNADGVIIIEGAYGILMVQATGAQVGLYTYALLDGVAPPKGAEELFTYTLTDAYGCSSTANLSIDLNVKQIFVPNAEAVDDMNAICVVEKVYGCHDPVIKVISSTKAKGNLLTNDLHLQVDPAHITKITNDYHPDGITPDTNGIITIEGKYGELTVKTTGPQAGYYTYTLLEGSTPSKCAEEIFTYTLKDAHNCESSAELSIDINVNQIFKGDQHWHQNDQHDIPACHQDNVCHNKPQPCDNKPQPCDNKPQPCDNKPQPCDNKPQPCNNKPQHCDNKPQQPCDNKPQHCDNKPQHCDAPPSCTAKHPVSWAPNACEIKVTELCFQANNAHQYLLSNMLAGLYAYLGKDGKTIHLPIPEDGSHVEFITPKGAHLSINNHGDYSYTVASNKIHETETFNCIVEKGGQHDSMPLVLNAATHPAALSTLIELNGSEYSPFGMQNKHENGTRHKEDTHNQDYIMDAKDLPAPSVLLLKELGIHKTHSQLSQLNEENHFNLHSETSDFNQVKAHASLEDKGKMHNQMYYEEKQTEKSFHKSASEEKVDLDKHTHKERHQNKEDAKHDRSRDTEPHRDERSETHDEGSGNQHKQHHEAPAHFAMPFSTETQILEHTIQTVNMEHHIIK